MKHPKRLFTFILAASLLLPAAVWAKPQVELSIKAEKEVTVTEKGQKLIKRLPAGTAAPGDIVIYTVTYNNTGNETASNIIVNDPIPEGTAYVNGSVTEAGLVTFSIDGGTTYKKASLLTYEIVTPDGQKEKRIASPEQYTNIRWEFPAIPPGDKGFVSFHVTVR